MTRTTFDVVAEPKGELLAAFLRTLGELSSSLLLVLRNELELDDRGQALLRELQQYVIERHVGSAWPGTVLHGDSATIIRLSAVPPVIEKIGRASEGLFGWVQPDLPEDPCLLRADGSPLLVTVSHERDAYLELTDEEQASITKTLPEIWSVVAHHAERE